MALFDTSRPVVANPGIGARIMKLVFSAYANVSAWNDARITRNALNKLSDHELDDLGLSRGDVDSMRFR